MYQYDSTIMLINVLKHNISIIDYASLQLKKNEKNYPTYDLDFTALIHSFKILGYYLNQGPFGWA